jgi:hypothetical protein
MLSSIAAAQQRSEKHEEYAAQLWKHIRDSDYTRWQLAPADLKLPCGPPCVCHAKTYLNAQAADSSLPHKALLVTEHYGSEPEQPIAITIRYRARQGFNAPTDDWYWAHYLADGTTVATMADDVSPFAKPGFLTYEDDGRLWIFRFHAVELGDFLLLGELAKHVIRPAAGPASMTVKAPDNETINAYLTAKPGFVTMMDDGRLWIFAAGCEELKAFERDGELAKHVIRPAAGPMGMTIKSPNVETIEAYMAAADGFVTKIEDGRVWVFRAGCPALADFEEHGELAKHVIRPAAGPMGMTVKSPDTETLEAYLRAISMY